MELNLKKLRKDKGFTQEKLAIAVGATKRQIGAWERGENDIPMDYAVSIADTLGCSVDEIAGRDKTMPVPMLTYEERQIIRMYRSMNAQGRERLIEQAAFLAERHPLNQAAEVRGA